MKPQLLFLSFLFVLFGCEKERNDQAASAPMVNNHFTLTLPEGWMLINEEGTDSYTGFYTNGKDKINFDTGIFSFGSLEDIKKGKNTLYYEETVIGNEPAKIVKEVHEGSIRLSAFIDRGDSVHLTWLYVYYPDNDQKYISIFKTHKFK
jgi:hypothetical protein